MRSTKAQGEVSDVIVDAMSVDLEDYFHVEAFAGSVSRADWPHFESRVRRNTERVLELFGRYNCRATFFVLGWVAERDPALIREVASAGHEIGCHSYWHRRVNTLSPAEFREDLNQARAAIEDACGAKVLGHRAPTFSIVKESLWALDVLADEGFLYDSSIFPVRHDTYGFPEATRWQHDIQLKNGRNIVEIPMSTVRIFGQNLPIVAYDVHQSRNSVHSPEREAICHRLLSSLGDRHETASDCNKFEVPFAALHWTGSNGEPACAAS